MVHILIVRVLRAVILLNYLRMNIGQLVLVYAMQSLSNEQSILSLSAFSSASLRRTYHWEHVVAGARHWMIVPVIDKSLRVGIYVFQEQRLKEPAVRRVARIEMMALLKSREERTPRMPDLLAELDPPSFNT